MNPVPQNLPPSDDTTFMRATVRGDMLRANTAMVVVFAGLLILLLAACLAAFRATQNLHRAEAAETRGQERLASAYLAQAHAMRVTAEPGRRQVALNAISNAAAISQSTELRTEAAACLALSELEQEGDLIPTPGVVDWTMDKNLEHFAYADSHGSITIYDSAGSKLFNWDTGHPVAGVMMSPDGHYLAVRFADHSVKIWDLESRQALEGPPLTAGLISAFSVDSRRLIYSDAANNGVITLCELPDFKIVHSNIKVGLRLFRVSSDLRTVAVGNGLAIDIFDLESGTNIMTLPHPTRALMVAWSGNGRKLAASCEDGDTYLWDMDTHRHKVLSGQSERCVSMGFSPDDTMLYTSSLDGSTRLWSVPLGQTIAVGEGIAHGFTTDQRRMGFWRPWTGMGIWKILPSTVYAVLPCDMDEGPLFSLDLSANGRWCVATQDKGFHIWDLNSRKNFYVPLTNFYDAVISPDERSLFVCTTNGMSVWPLPVDDKDDLNLQAAAAKPIPLPDGLGARAVAVSSNGECAAVELTDRRMAVLDLTGKKQTVFLKHGVRLINYKGPGSATGAGRFAISPDGRWIATGFNFDTDDTPKVWDTTSGEMAVELNAGTSMVGFSADGRWLCLAGTGRSSVWSVGTWRQQMEIARDEPSITHGAIALVSQMDAMAVARTRKIIQMRDLKTGNVLIDLIPPVPQSINAVHVSNDGSVLVTATASDMVEVWYLGGLRRHLAVLGLDWGPSAQNALVHKISARSSSTALTLTWLIVLGVFALAAGFMSITLRRHRRAIQRFVVAEATTAHTNRKLDMAKIELMHSQKMQALGTLATGIAHDFNNLLSVIRMSNTLVGRRAVSDAEIQEYVADIEQAVLQGKGVVSSMLGYARDNGGNGEPADVNSVVENVVSLLSREFLGGIALVLELERGAPRVAVGRGMLEQILLNLVVNASEAMEGKGNLKIIVRTRTSLPEGEYVLRPQVSGRLVELIVVDSGPGIAPEAWDHIFEPFFTTKRAGSKVGTGLGLSLVYSMIQQAEAGLMVKSTPRQGAAFTLLFPAIISEPVRQTHSSQKNQTR